MTSELFQELKKTGYYTVPSPISNLPAKISPQRINERIKEIERKNYIINENDFPHIELFLKSPFYEEERKNKLKKHLDENYNLYLFNKLFNNLNNIPLKLNGIPYKRSGPLEFPSSEIKEFLLNGNMLPERKNDIMFYSTLIDFCEKPYFKSEFCYYQLKLQLKYLDTIKPEILRERQIISQQEDDKQLSHLKQQNNKEKEYHINSDFKNLLLSKIPEDFNQLEKSIFIYLKLCDYFSYNPKSYATNNSTEESSIKKIESLSQNNKNVVCYEFTYALSDILTSIGIKCIDNISYWFSEKEDGSYTYDSFREQHANLKYIVDDIIIFADSTKSVLEGDLSKWKFSNQVDGIRCENYSIDKRKEFDKALQKVIKHINLSEKRFHIDDIRKEYEQLKQESYLSLKDKMNFMYEKISQFPYDEVDLISYINRLKEIIFTKDELDDKISIIPVRNNENNTYLLLSANNTSFKYSPHNTYYYSINPKSKKIHKLELEQVINSFKNKLLTLIEENDTIPSFKTKEQQVEEMIKQMEEGTLNVNKNSNKNPEKKGPVYTKKISYTGYTISTLLFISLITSGIVLLIIATIIKYK